ncbi:FitA-like ribbon-helix-helix domain-containing protein [Nocardia takedensis]|uniref:FitA-like ribbon-helix-helix domain-containing protein n=1 Tax=Nocardia takedensis TaxID=259390 RepID=UPI001FE036A7|nr:Arc family DNA-binding protein [Nocardia takedensis]
MTAVANVTIRNLPDEVHRAVKMRAAARGRSAEAELRAIITEAVLPEDRVKLGSLLAEVGREIEVTDEEYAALTARDDEPAAPLDLDR